MKKFLIFFFVGLFIVACEQQSTYSTDAAVIERGKTLFEGQCSACHNFLTSGMGPNLAGVTTEASAEWLRQFIRNPAEMIDAGDERATALFQDYKTYMPPFGSLPEEDIDALLAYLNTYPEKIQLESTPDLGPPIGNPFPDTIPFSGMTLVLREVIQMPATAEEGPLARINKMMPLPGSDRLFMHDIRGTLYEITGNKPQAFLHVPDYFPAFKDQPGWATGLSSFTFHPEYLKNGLFYTNHVEDPNNGKAADFAFEDSLKINIQAVLTEWKHDKPGSGTFSGTKRELMRVNFVGQAHSMQEITFNPLAKPGDEDYGLLYIGMGDGSSVGAKAPFLVQDKTRIWGNILRIDPAGNNSKNGQYGIPPGNPYSSEVGQGALGEIYAMGFRNAHRLTWDKADGKMLASGIGQHQVEEINIIEPGRNYGWPEREGTFRFDKNGDFQKLYALPENDEAYGYTYPVAQFDHDEGAAICGGYVYYGEQVPALRGKYLFGDIFYGRIFSVDAADLRFGHQSPISKFKVKVEGSTAKDLMEITSEFNNKADLRFGIDSKGEIYVFTKADGRVYQIVGVEGDEI
jgi:mono/diheme cytochrome c family protein